MNGVAKLDGVLHCCCCCGLTELCLRAAAATAGAAAELLTPCLLGWGPSDGHPVSVLDDQVLAATDLASVQRGDGLCHVQHNSQVWMICYDGTKHSPAQWHDSSGASRMHAEYSMSSALFCVTLQTEVTSDEVQGGRG